MSDRFHGLYRGGFGAVAVLAATVVWAATVDGTILTRVCSWKPLIWFGVRSYSLYLWHWPVIALSQPGVDFSVSANRWAIAGGRFVVSLVLTELSFRFVEEPFRKKLLGRWVASIVGRPGAILRTPKWYAGTFAAALLVVGGAAGVSRAAQNDGIADSLRASGDEVVVGTSLGVLGRPVPTAAAALAGVTPVAASVGLVVASTVPPTIFPTPPPDPALATTTTNDPSTTATVVATASPTTAPVTTTPVTTTTTPTPTTFPRPPAVLAIGDSIMKGAAPALAARLGDGSVIDAAVSRQFTAGIKVLEKQTAKGRAFGAIVVHLGNNGVPSPKQFQEFMAKAGTVTPIVFITMRESREWAPKLNALLRSETKNYRNLRIMEWNEAAGNYSYLFAKDKLHLSGTGGRYYSDLVVWNLAQAGYVGAPTPPASTARATTATTDATATTATTTATNASARTTPTSGSVPSSTASGGETSTAVSPTTAGTRAKTVVAAKTVKSKTSPTATTASVAKLAPSTRPPTNPSATSASTASSSPPTASPSTVAPTQPPSTKAPETGPPATPAPEAPSSELPPPVG